MGYQCFLFHSNLVFFCLLVFPTPKMSENLWELSNLLYTFDVTMTWKGKSLNMSSGKSLFGSEVKMNFKAFLSVSASTWKISTFSIRYFFVQAWDFFCRETKCFYNIVDETLRESFANINNFPDINRALDLTSFLFLLQKI